MSNLQLAYGSHERVSMWEAVINELYDLSPWERWMAYRKVPWNEVLHVALLALSTASVVLSCDAWNEYMIATNQNICHFFFPQSCQSDICDALWMGPVDDCLVYTMNDTRDAIYNATAQYYAINRTSLAAYSYVLNSEGSIEAPELYVCYHNTPTVVTPYQCYTYIVTPENLGPLDVEYGFFKMLDHMTLSFKLIDKFQGDIYRGRYTWNIGIRYDLHNRGNILVSSTSTITTDSTDFNEYFWLYSIILIVAVIYMCMVIKDLVIAYRILKFARKLFERIKEHNAIPDSSLALSHQQSWEHVVFTAAQNPSQMSSGPPAPPSPSRSVPARSKLRAPFDLYGEEIDGEIPEWDRLSLRTRMCFFDSWAPFHILGSFITATTACIRLQQTNRYEGVPTDTRNMLEGLGCAILWINLLGYLRHSNRLYMLVLILYGSFSRVFRVMISSSPMFVGVALLGMSLFACYDPSFGTFRSTFSTLFSVMNGDTVKDTILAADGVIRLGGNMFIIFFFLMFNYVIMRLLICVVESILCYIHIYSVAHRKRMHWRKDRARLLGLAAYTRPHTHRISVISQAVYADHKNENERMRAMAIAEEILFYELLDLCQREDEEGNTTHVENFLTLDGHESHLSCLEALHDQQSITADERDKLVTMLTKAEQEPHIFTPK